MVGVDYTNPTAFTASDNSMSYLVMVDEIKFATANIRNIFWMTYLGSAFLGIW